MTNELTEERLRNTRAWAAARIGSLSGADVIVGAIDELLEYRRIVGYEPASPAEPKSEPIVQWLVENVDDRDVPDDEGNADALLFNLVQLARHGRPYEKYAYKPEQDEEVARLRSSVNRQEPSCEHLRSELLAEKTKDGDPLFQMRKCLDCSTVFRVRSSLNRKGDA